VRAARIGLGMRVLDMATGTGLAAGAALAIPASGDAAAPLAPVDRCTGSISLKYANTAFRHCR
jgi:hypothetical protein